MELYSQFILIGGALMGAGVMLLGMVAVAWMVLGGLDD